MTPLARILASLERTRPEAERGEAWRTMIDWLRENHLRGLLGKIRRRGPDLDPVAVLHEFYLGFLESPPKDETKMRLQFRVLDACRKVRKQDAGGPPGRVSLDVWEEGLPDGDSTVSAPEQAALEADAARSLETLVQALPEGRLREVARLRYQEGESLKSISQRLGVPLGTIKSDLNREVRPRLKRLESEQRWAAQLKRGGV